MSGAAGMVLALPLVQCQPLSCGRQICVSQTPLSSQTLRLGQIAPVHTQRNRRLPTLHIFSPGEKTWRDSAVSPSRTHHVRRSDGAALYKDRFAQCQEFHDPGEWTAASPDSRFCVLLFPPSLHDLHQAEDAL